MQHLDEGTIHAWLDGALPPDEAAHVEAHVAECAECAAKVAEARGFIAASSRILTALDDVPRGVIPAARTRPRINRSFLQAAAVLLVVATGSLLIMRNRPAEMTQRVAASNASDKRVSVAAAPTAAADSSSGARPAATPVPRSRTGGIAAGSVTSPEKRVAAATVVAPPPAAAVATVAAAPLVVATAPPAAESWREPPHDTSLTIMLSRDQLRLQAVVTTGVATTAALPLKVLKTERMAGGTRTTYEITPDRIVTLVEYDSSTAPAPSGNVAGVRAKPQTNTIRWTDESTGTAFALSGPFSVSELESIRQRIERLRSTR